VTLTWSAPLDNGGYAITGYEVYRAAGSATPVKIATVTALSYVDESGAQGTTYLYKVCAVNAKGEGAMASVSSASLYPPPAPSNLQVTREGSGAVLTWTMPSSNASSAEVTGFAIYRVQDGNEACIGYVNSSGATSYTDAEAPSGEVQYRVVAMNGETTALSSMSPAVDLSTVGSSTDPVLPLATFGAIAAILLLFMVVGRKKKDD
jgi:titin